MHTITRTALLFALLPAIPSGGLVAQSSGNGEGVEDTAVVTPVPEREGVYMPFRNGERLVYETRVGLFGEVGEGWLEVGTDTVGGMTTRHFRFGLQASTLFGAYKVDNLLQSWVDPGSLHSVRFQKDQQEPFYETHKVYDFLTDEGEWRLRDTDEVGPLSSEYPLDDVSIIYYVRTLPLNVGDRYVIEDYFREDGNPVVLEVLRTETVKVPAGQFETVVVRPIIQTDGLFAEEGEAELYFTNDSLKLLVMIKARVPVLRSLEFRLKSWDIGG